MKKYLLTDLFPETVKWWAYTWLDFLLNRQNSGIGNPDHESIGQNRNLHQTVTGQSFQWFFCSTIGELLACKPLIAHIANKSNLVLLTDRTGYTESYLHHFPKAVVVELTAQRKEVAHLLDTFPPKALYLCEIPCMPGDAPCRLPYGILRAVKKRKARIYMVNGWVYGYQPSCRQDALERYWFTRHYLAMFDKITVQTEEVKQKLIARGAAENLVDVTGNMKFDIFGDPVQMKREVVTERLLNYIQENAYRTVVAGCLSAKSEYKDIAIAGKTLLQKQVIDLLIIAPRHPENAEHMRALLAELTKTGYAPVMKSKLAAKEIPTVRIVILDTIGELQQIYSGATAAFVGRNHNVLEPLKYGKPVVVQHGWQESYPSYPVYRATLECGLIRQAKNAGEISDELQELCLFDSALNQSMVKEKLSNLSGALERNILLTDSQ